MFSGETLESALDALPAIASCHRFAVAYSGGADSTALLVALSELRSRQLAEGVAEPVAIRALHFNHQIHPLASTWQQHCEQRCISLGIKIESGIWPASPGLTCTEEQARQARYQWLSAHLQDGEVLLTAHHADDQAETVLLNLLQGRGVHRLGGIPAVRSLGKQGVDNANAAAAKPLVARPLLGVRRLALVVFLQQRDLSWIEDAANFADRHRRSFLRQQIMPLLRDRFPGCDDSLTAAAERLQRANNLLDRDAAAFLAGVLQPSQRRLLCLADPIDIRLLGRLDRAVQTDVVRRWIHGAGFAAPSERKLHELLRQLGTADFPGNEIGLHSNDTDLLVYDHTLYLLESKPAHEPEKTFSADRTTLCGDLEVELIKSDSPGLSAVAGGDSDLRWRWRRGGERFHSSGKSHSQSLKKLFQEYKIPRFERDRLPLLWAGEQLLWVHGIGFSDCLSGLRCHGNNRDCFEPVFRYKPESSILAGRFY